MRCYYELLGVEENVERDEIRKAFYKLSLKWHPDKNAPLKDTTSIFQEIQEAYRVLSDPQERAWYDKHRAQILQGDGRATQMGAPTEYAEERVDVFKFFTRSCFDKFDDGPMGFYTIYRKVFNDIADEERRVASFSGYKSSTGNDYPSFGLSSSCYSDVVATFYTFWESFETCKTYSWVEKYDTRCAESRSERRAMETENRRLRNAAIRKRNEEIHQLVAYVKKRDKRVLNEKERIQRIAIEAQARSRNLAVEAKQRDATELEEAWNEQLAYGGMAFQWSEQFEAELERMEAELDGLVVEDNTNEQNTIKSNQEANENRDYDDQNGNYNLDDSENECQETELYDELFCYACDKLFASIKAKENHEGSKKHRKQMELLKNILINEDVLIQNTSTYADNENDDLVNLDKTELSNVIIQTCSPLLSPSHQEIKRTKRAKKAERERRKAEQKQVEQQRQEGNEKDKEENPLRVPNILNNVENRKNMNFKNKEESRYDSKKSITTVCETCSEEFLSRNLLFEHLRETGHAKLKTVISNNSHAKTVQNKIKPKRH